MLRVELTYQLIGCCKTSVRELRFHVLATMIQSSDNFLNVLHALSCQATGVQRLVPAESPPQDSQIPVSTPGLFQAWNIHAKPCSQTHEGRKQIDPNMQTVNANLARFV